MTKRRSYIISKLSVPSKVLFGLRQPAVSILGKKRNMFGVLARGKKGESLSKYMNRADIHYDYGS